MAAVPMSESGQKLTWRWARATSALTSASDIVRTSNIMGRGRLLCAQKRTGRTCPLSALAEVIDRTRDGTGHLSRLFNFGRMPARTLRQQKHACNHENYQYS
jgi:hypothetical protein